jgi:hypothetical protein
VSIVRGGEDDLDEREGEERVEEIETEDCEEEGECVFQRCNRGDAVRRVRVFSQFG